MEEIRTKTVAQSRTEQVHIVMPSHLNQSFRLFGGQLMQWIDVVAGVVARRHCGCEVTTAAVDHLVFEAPACMNDIIVLRGRVTYVGRSSMEVCVETFVEQVNNEDRCVLVNRAYLTMVALDQDKRPVAVPQLELLTDEERADFAAGKARREARLKLEQKP